ncbi:DUF4340 domain-containing protein [Paenibacillus flagellatus]|uniref:DUF4340 domain-containing protein n=1 Tax=Paenibacillus flagellatus TaxID=2211139 RepID=A0A2V5K0N4_9BACL|nr:DUF4340 domain-containing protein [Paenibacillus flagellatus]PYI51224.1 hypothetical protein DLM86_26435 [Paenibacillus flagellatus]
MKRFIPTIVLVVVCIGAFWYASTQSFFKKKDEETASKPLVAVKSDDVTGVKIKEGGLEFQKKDGQWAMVKPSVYPLESNAVEGWLAGFTSLTHDGEVEANPADLSVFGLKDPAKEYEVTLADGSVKTVQIGSPLPIAGHFYAKLKDAPAVYKLPEQEATSLAKDAFGFMNKTPVKMTYNEVSGLQVDWKGASKSIVKSEPAKTASESAWKLGDQELKGSDAETMLDKLLLMTTAVPVRPASELKLDAAELKLTVKSTKDGTESTNAYAGKVDGDNVWIVKQGDAWAYAVPTATIQELFDAMKVPEAKPASESK